MKVSILIISIIIPLAIPVESRASSEVEYQSQVQSPLLLDGLNKSKSVDPSNMTLPQRKALKKEMQEATKHAKEPGGGGGIFISLAPLLLVILLLIILL